MIEFFEFDLARNIYRTIIGAQNTYYPDDSVFGIPRKEYENIIKFANNEYCGEPLELEDFDENDVCSYYWFPRCVVMSSDEEVLMKDVKNNWEKVMVIAKTNPEIINYL